MAAAAVSAEQSSQPSSKPPQAGESQQVAFCERGCIALAVGQRSSQYSLDRGKDSLKDPGRRCQLYRLFVGHPHQ